jgi:tight adherence protein B
MGMTFTEYSLFAGGSICLAFFLLRTIAPYFRFRLDRTAETTSRILREEFLSLGPDRLRRFLLAAGALTAFAAMISTRNVLWAMVAGFFPVFLPGLVVRHVRSRRRKRIVAQLPAFLEILSGYVNAGHSIPESLQEAIPLLPSGVREEVTWLCQMVRLGTPLTDVLLAWAQRMESEEVSMIVLPLRIAIPAGGNLYDLLTRCRDVLRAKIRQEEKMRSMTAQARLQALILTLLPPAFIAVLSRIEPGYIARCRETTAGRTILAITAALQLLGWFFIRRIMAGSK